MAYGYDIAQVCMNGHVTNSSFITYPEDNRAHCPKCGEKTLNTCPQCNKSIRGAYHGDIPTLGHYLPPSFCEHCGSPYPWTKQKIEAAIQMATEFGGLNGEESSKFAESVVAIVQDKPNTQLAATRVKAFLARAGKETASAIRDIMVDITSETAKKIIWPSK